MARAATLPNDQNCTLAELETAMRAAPTLAGYRRMAAIHLILRGQPPRFAALAHAVHRTTVQRWVRRFNAAGIDGLLDASRCGRPRRISRAQSERYRGLIEQPESAGQAHWTAKKFHGYLRTELDHELSYSTVLRWLHQQGFRLKVPQPWPNRQAEPTTQHSHRRQRLLAQERLAELGRLRAALSSALLARPQPDREAVDGDQGPPRRIHRLHRPRSRPTYRAS
jgi:transposase